MSLIVGGSQWEIAQLFKVGRSPLHAHAVIRISYDDRDLSSCKITTKTRRWRAQDQPFMPFIPKWKTLADMKQARRREALVCIPTGHLVITGGFNGAIYAPIDSVECLSLKRPQLGLLRIVHCQAGQYLALKSTQWPLVQSNNYTIACNASYVIQFPCYLPSGWDRRKRAYTI